MGKFVFTVFCVLLASALSSAQDIRRLMLMRQRELALRRAGFPFGVGGPIRGPGIPPPLAARLALLERQRAFVPFIGSPFDTTFLSGARISSGGPFSFGGPFSSPFSLSGPPDLSGIDLSNLDLSSSGPSGTFTFPGSDGAPTIGDTPSFNPFGIGLPIGPFAGGLPSGPVTGPFGGGMPSGPIGLPDGGSGISGGPSGVPTTDGSSGGSVETGGSGNVFGQPTTQASEFLETNRATVEPSPQMENSGPRHMINSRSGFNQVDDRRNGPIPNSPMDRFRTRPENPRDMPPVQLQPPLPDMRPPMPLVGPNNPMMRGPVPMPLPGQQSFMPLAPPMFPMSPPGPMMSPRRPNRRRNPRRRRNQRPTTPRVFPRVPEIPQIPLAPSGQDQQNAGQQTGIGGFGAEGGSQTDSQSLVFNSQAGIGAQNGDPRMGVQSFMPGQIGGMGPGFPSTGPGFTSTGPGFQPSGPGFSAGPGFPPTGPGFSGPMRQGGAIFPSQSAQQPTMRQPGPGFSEAFSGSTTSFTASPNGQPPQQLQGGGAQAFGQSNRFLQPGEVSPGGFPAGAVFPGLSGSPFGSTIVGPAPGQGFGGRGPGGPFAPSFGFVGPNNAAGPAFSTNSQSAQGFNIQFQPLPGMPQGQEFRPGQGQMGMGPNVPPMRGNGGFSSSGQANMQFGQQNNFGGGFGQSNGQFGASQSNTQFGNEISTSNKFDGGVSQSGMQTGGAGQNSFSSGGSSSSSSTTVVTTRPSDTTMNFGSNNQNTASLTVTDRVVEENMLNNNNNNNEFRLVEVGDIVDNAGLVKQGVTDVNTDGTNTRTITEIRTTSFQPTGDINTAFESFGTVPVENIIDLSMTDPANDMNTVAADTSASKTVSTSSTTTRSSSSSSSSSSNSLSGSPFASSINNDFSFFMDNSPPPNEMPPITLTSDTTGSQTMTFPVTGNTGSEMTSSGGQSGGFTMTSSSSFSSSSSSPSGSTDNSMGDISMGDNTMGDITIPGINSPTTSNIGSTVPPAV